MSKTDPNNPCVFCSPFKLCVNEVTEVESLPITVYKTVPLNPVTEGHTIYFPALHVPDAQEDRYVSSLVFRAMIYDLRGAEGDYNIITSKGRNATQSVWHLHIHYVPRTENDGLRLPWTI